MMEFIVPFIVGVVLIVLGISNNKISTYPFANW